MCCVIHVILLKFANPIMMQESKAQWSSRTHSTSFRKFGDNCLETSQKLLGMILDTQTNIEKSLGVLLCTVKFSSVLYHIVII